MTAPTRPTYIAPECRVGLCEPCPGPQELRIPGQTPTAPPVQTLRCDCDCHTRGARG